MTTRLEDLVGVIEGLPPAEAEAAFRAVVDRSAAEDLLWSWPLWARPEQIEPAGVWRWWLIMTGRRWGKTRSAAEWIRERAESGRAKHIALIAQDPLAARKIMVEEGPSSLVRIARPGFEPVYSPSTKTLHWPNGVVATVYSAEDPDQIRGGEFDTAWIDEFAALKKLQVVWDNIAFALSAQDAFGGQPRGVISTTPRPLKLLRSLLTDDDVHVTRGRLIDNIANLDPIAVKKIREAYEGSRIGRQELDGDVLIDVEGALWNLRDIDDLRREEHPDLVHLVVGVDPSASSNPGTSAECGIVVCGRGTDGHGYVLDDRSAVLSPKGWGRRVVDAFWDFGANEVVAETNNGGAMVATIIRDIDPRVPVRSVNAARGKHTRAEPISALYENEQGLIIHPGRMHHVGTFPLLEDQMTQWTGVAGELSPDRMDALVWAAWAVMIDEVAFVDFV